MFVREGFIKNQKKSSGIFHKGGEGSAKISYISRTFFSDSTYAMNHANLHRNIFFKGGGPSDC